jgi:hypothetical protein
LDFSLLPLVKLSLLILFASFFVSVLCFFFDGSPFKVIALRDSDSCRSFSLLKAIAKRLPLLFPNAIVGRAITIWEAIQKRSHESIYKTHKKVEAKRLRATTFAIAKLEER